MVKENITLSNRLLYIVIYEWKHLHVRPLWFLVIKTLWLFFFVFFLVTDVAYVTTEKR